MPARSSVYTGGWRDNATGKWEIYVKGTLVGTFDDATADLTLPTNGLPAASIANDSLEGDQVANVANVNTEGGIPLIYRIDIAAVGATLLTADTDITVVDKIRVLDVMVLKLAGTTAGGAENVTIKNGANAITDVMSWTGADKSIVRAATIDDANHEIAAAGTLRVTIDTSITDETSDAGQAIITAIKVA